MSLTKDNYVNYFRAVELHWSIRRERQIIVSPIEFDAIDTWHQSQVPLPVVLRAIDQFLERKAKAKRPRSILLNHAHKDVERVHHEYQQLHTGLAAGEADSGGLTSIIRRLTRKLNQLARSWPACEQASLDIANNLKKLDIESLTSLADVEETLMKWDKQLIDEFEAQMNASERVQLVSDLDELMADDDDVKLRDRVWRDMVRYHFDIPRLTTLGN